MLSVMVCMSWQSMGAWHNYTKAHIPVGRLTAWRVNPTPKTLARVPLDYQPTKLQISVPHPAVIDWIPWASMRDLVILHHSSSPRLDDLICELGNHYVMEVDLSQLVAGFPPTPGYVSVWDLVRTISPEATTAIHEQHESPGEWEHDYLDSGIQDPLAETDHLDDKDTTLPACNVTALFTSKALALKAFEMMGMSDGPHKFRLDPAFFEKYPELYDCSANLAATGIPLRPGHRKSVPVPRPLARRVLSQYKELASWAVALVPQRHVRF